MRYVNATIQEEVANMKIKLNPDQVIVNPSREGLKRTGGCCPCRRERTEATKCMCQEEIGSVGLLERSVTIPVHSRHSRGAAAVTLPLRRNDEYAAGSAQSSAPAAASR